MRTTGARNWCATQFTWSSAGASLTAPQAEYYGTLVFLDDLETRLADAVAFRLEDGLKWRSGDRVRHETDLTAWRGKRAQAGAPPPFGFPKPPRFDRDA